MAGLPRWLCGKKKNMPANAVNAGDAGSVPGLGMSLRGGNGKPL